MPPVAASTVVYTRPARSTFSGTVSGLGDALKQGPAHGQCDASLAQNKLAGNKCAACQGSKMPVSDGTKQTGTLTPFNSAIKSALSTRRMQGFGEKFKVAAGTWASRLSHKAATTTLRGRLGSESHHRGLGPLQHLPFPSPKGQPPLGSVQLLWTLAETQEVASDHLDLLGHLGLSTLAGSSSFP